MTSYRVKVAALLASAALVVWALITLQDVLLPVLLALLLAYLLDPLVALLERLGLPRTRAIALIYLLGLVGVVLVILFVIPWFAGQASALAGRLGDLLNRLPALGVRTVAWVEGRLGIDLALRQEVQRFSEQTKVWLLSHRADLFLLSSGTLRTGWTGFQGLLVLLMNGILVPIYAYFFLLGLNRLPGLLRDLLPGSYRERGMSVLTQIHQTMAAFFRGRLLICVGKGLVAALGMAIGGVPFGVVVGLASGVMSLVPFLAFPVGAVLGCSFALLEGQGMGGVLWVLGALGAAELFESVANPWILGREMALHPAVVLFSLIVGGKCLGVMGLLLAVPMASMLKIVWKELLFPWWREVADRPEPP